MKTVGRNCSKAGWKVASGVVKNPGKTSELGAKESSAAVSRNLEATISTFPDVMSFFTWGKGVILDIMYNCKYKNNFQRYINVYL